MRRVVPAAVAGLLGLACIFTATRRESISRAGHFVPPEGVNVTYFPALRREAGLPLVLSASIDAGFMRPFLIAFQRHEPATSIVYMESRGGAFLDQALQTCQSDRLAADLYLTASTDQLMRLANENCAQTLPASIGAAAPAQAHWRDEVVAFTVEPAVFVLARSIGGELPASHVELLDWLRRRSVRECAVGVYDIEKSADGYNFAASDSRQAALYGRLLEGLGRAGVRLYCCSNVMVDALDRGEIGFAYNVQLSYAYAAQRAGSRIAVVMPNDYQALQTLSLMVPKGARTPAPAVRLAAFLVSPEARALARRELAPPRVPSPQAQAIADRLLAKASVTPLLLSLQDRARRRQLIREWRQAMVRPILQKRDDDADQAAPR